MAPITELTTRRSIERPTDLDWFWQIVDASVRDEQDAQLTALRTALDALPDQDLVDYAYLYRQVHAGLGSGQLWAAAYLINGGCSDDGFIDFRAWLIAMGRATAEVVAADVERLADLGIEMDSASFESFGYVQLDAFRARAGGAFPRNLGPKVSQTPGDPAWCFDFDDDARMRRRLPRLAALYL